MMRLHLAQFCLPVNPVLLEDPPSKNRARFVTASISHFCFRSEIETISYLFTLMAEVV